MHTCSGVAKEGVEDACHKRKAFTATVVKVTGTEGDGGINATLMRPRGYCVYVPRNVGICAISRLRCTFLESRDCTVSGLRNTCAISRLSKPCVRNLEIE